MIPILLVIGLLTAGAVVAAVTFWDQIKKFLGLALKKVKEIIGATIIGVATYIQTDNWREGFKAFYKFYSQNTKGQWQETITTKTISADEVPDHIKKKCEKTTDQVDISEELQLELS